MRRSSSRGPISTRKSALLENSGSTSPRQSAEALRQILRGRQRFPGVARATRVRYEPAEAKDIQLVGRDVQPIAVSERLDLVSAEHLPEVRDPNLQ